MAKAKTRTVTRYVKTKTRRRAGVQIPLAVALPAGYLIAEVVSGGMKYGPTKGMQIGVKHMTGFDSEIGKWSSKEFMRGGGPILMGMLVHKVATKFGVNRALSRVPYLRI